MEETEKKKSCNNHNSCPRCKCRSDKKLNVYDWLEDIPESHNDTDFVEVQFKNTRKGYYRNSNKLDIAKGDIVAVEATPGHDIGEVTLTGRLVLLQMKKNNIRLDNVEVKRVYRKAKPADLEKFEEAKSREHDTMLRARKIAEDLKLNMKIGDVEYQGDGNKAIFYYIADDRVDFRQLIKVLADAFKVRIEMKQIGARQEAGRIGGIGPCGRELCCSGWMTNFVSVATSAARFQEISLNPQKLAGQCAKLKCCMNYEVDGYVEAQKQLPSKDAVLYTKQGEFYHFKTDIYKYQLTYSTSRDFPANLVTISSSRVFEIIALNKRGIKVDALAVEVNNDEPKKEFSDVVGQDSLTRFDKSKKNKKNKNKQSQKDDVSKSGDEAARDAKDKSGAVKNQGENKNNANTNNPNNPNFKGNQNNRDRQDNSNRQNNNRDNQNPKKNNPNKGNRPNRDNENQERRNNQPNVNAERNNNDLREQNNNQPNNQNVSKDQNNRPDKNFKKDNNQNNRKNNAPKPNRQNGEEQNSQGMQNNNPQQVNNHNNNRPNNKDKGNNVQKDNQNRANNSNNDNQKRVDNAEGGKEFNHAESRPNNKRNFKRVKRNNHAEGNPGRSEERRVGKEC